MNYLAHITPLILTYNESHNIGRTLGQLHWAARIVVIDSFSTDDTLSILQQYPQVEVYQRKFDTHGKQWNYGLEQVKSAWILSLDADYWLSPPLIEELKNWTPEANINGYFINFKYCVWGKPLRTTILPARQAFFLKSAGSYIDDGHTQVLKINGKSGSLKSAIHHDDRKPLSRWLWAQDRYAHLEVEKLKHLPKSELGLNDRIRKLKMVAPFLVFFYCLIWKRGLLDGWQGWYYAFQRMIAELILSVYLLEDQFKK